MSSNLGKVSPHLFLQSATFTASDLQPYRNGSIFGTFIIDMGIGVNIATNLFKDQHTGMVFCYPAYQERQDGTFEPIATFTDPESRKIWQDKALEAVGKLNLAEIFYHDEKSKKP